MSKAKSILAPKEWEIPCYAVCVAYDEKITKKILSDKPEDVEEVKNYIGSLAEITKPFGIYGVHNQGQGVSVLIRKTDDGKDVELVEAVYQAFHEKGHKTFVAKELFYADGRYERPHYKGLVVTIPPDEMEREIVRILDEHCHEWHCESKPDLDMLFYEGDLGGKKLTIATQFGSGAFSCGLESGQMHYSREVNKYWRKMLIGLEADIMAWKKEHPNLAKQRHEA